MIQYGRTRLEGVIRAFAGNEDQLAMSPTLLSAADLLEEGASAVVVGPPVHALAQALADTALAAPDPSIAVLRVPPRTPCRPGIRRTARRLEWKGQGPMCAGAADAASPSPIPRLWPRASAEAPRERCSDGPMRWEMQVNAKLKP